MVLLLLSGDGEDCRDRGIVIAAQFGGYGRSQGPGLPGIDRDQNAADGLTLKGIAAGSGGHDARLAFEALVEGALGDQVGRQQFERDLALQPRVVGAIDNRHPALAQDVEELIAVGGWHG